MNRRSFTTRQFVGRVGLPLLSACTVGVLALGGTAGASVVGPAPGSHTGAASTTALRGSTLGDPSACGGCAPPLVFQGGPVLGTADQPGAVTITPVYWAPSGYSYPDGYEALVNQYLVDAAHDSGTTGNVYGINTEYSGLVNGAPKAMAYSLTAGSPLSDTTAYPETGQCSEPAGSAYTACLGTAQIEGELASFLAAGQHPADLAHMYLLMLPPNVQSEDTSDGSRSNDGWCGLHSAFNVNSGSGTVVYGLEPFLPGSGCNDGQSPNANRPADTAITVISHEVNEAITDPGSVQPGYTSVTGYRDAKGNEIGDECNGYYGPPLGAADPDNPNTTKYNQVINGHKYYTQTSYSNRSYAADGVGKGCIGGAFQDPAATASGVRASRVKAKSASGVPDSMTVEMSTDQLPADGAATATVTATVLDVNGEPVAGDPVHLGTAYALPGDGAGPNQLGGPPAQKYDGPCGTVTDAPSGGHVTDINGQVEVTYTASHANVACDVVATEAMQGKDDSVVAYQGSSSANEPTLTQTVPSAVSPGGAPVTFAVTATNPSSGSIPDARFNVYLTGDAGATTGLDAKQVSLSYADDATGNKFVDVPLEGTTRADGEIAGYVVPDTATDVPAHSSKTVTFKLSLAAGAPDSGSTGAPLTISTNLDEFNAADASQSNLAATAPDVVPVTAAGASASSSPTSSPDGTPSGSPTATAPGAPPTVTVTPDTLQVGSGQQATVSGSATPGSTVSIYAYSRPSTKYALVRSTTVGPDGRYSLAVKPLGNTRLFARAVTQGQRYDSPSVVLFLRSGISLKVTRTGVRTYRFTGSVLPVRPGQVVNVYYQGAGAKVVASKTKVLSSGRYDVTRTFTGTGTVDLFTATGTDISNLGGTAAKVRTTIK